MIGQHGAQTLTFLIAINARRHAYIVRIWHKHQIARRNGNIGGQTRTFGAQRVFDHLHQQFLALVQHAGNMQMTIAFGLLLHTHRHI